MVSGLVDSGCLRNRLTWLAATSADIRIRQFSSSDLSKLTRFYLVRPDHRNSMLLRALDRYWATRDYDQPDSCGDDLHRLFCEVRMG